MAKTVMSKQQVSTIMHQGRVLKQDANGGYTVEYNGKKYYVPKNLAIFYATNPFKKQTEKFIEKRKVNIANNEMLLLANNKVLKDDTNKLSQLLSSYGIKPGQEKNLTSSQKTKVFDLKQNISDCKHSINRIKMSIMGDLLSNFMDCCSLMKMF